MGSFSQPNLNRHWNPIVWIGRSEPIAPLFSDVVRRIGFRRSCDLIYPIPERRRCLNPGSGLIALLGFDLLGRVIRKLAGNMTVMLD